MGARIGIDVGGTFTDFILTRDGAPPLLHKVLSTPSDPSIAVVTGIEELAAMVDPRAGPAAFAASIDTIVHGTTVTTNATLTHTGAKSALLTTAGVRDALEMRRGIREAQYDNTYTNVKPLVPRYLRIGVRGRLDRAGREVEPLAHADVDEAIALFRREGVEAVSICFLHSYANPAHEEAAAARVRAAMPGVFMTVSSRLMPSIRFYERISTTALNSYVGPKLERYVEQLVRRLAAAGFRGSLLIMQSNGGVMSPDVARASPALTLLSGPAGGPGAGLFYAKALGVDRAITTDMGGTSFEASVAAGGPILVNDGEIARHKIALPMLDIHTIGAGGGSIGWVDPGGFLQVGPQSAGAQPGPACSALVDDRPGEGDLDGAPKAQRARGLSAPAQDGDGPEHLFPPWNGRSLFTPQIPPLIPRILTCPESSSLGLNHGRAKELSPNCPSASPHPLPHHVNQKPQATRGGSMKKNKRIKFGRHI